MLRTLFVFLLTLFYSFTLTLSHIHAAPTLSIVSPTENSVLYGTTVNLKFSIPGLNLVDYKKYPRATYGQGHLHLWVDQNEFLPTSAIKITNDTYTLENLKYGSHTLVVEAVTNDHSSLIPKTVAIIKFTTVPPKPTASTSPKGVLLISFLAFAMATTALYFTNLHLQTLKSTPKPKSKPKSKSKRSK